MPRYVDADAFIALEEKLYCQKCDNRFETKNGKFREIYAIGDTPWCWACGTMGVLADLDDYADNHTITITTEGVIRSKKREAEDDEIVD